MFFIDVHLKLKVAGHPDIMKSIMNYTNVQRDDKIIPS